MAADNMTAQAAGKCQCPFQIDGATNFQLSQRGALYGLRHHISPEAAAVKLRYRQADAVHRNAVTQLHILQHPAGRHLQHAAADCLYPAHFFNNSCKHVLHLLTQTHIVIYTIRLWIFPA